MTAAAEPLGRLAATCAALATALPLALMPFMPGGDTPWHAALVAVLASDDPARYLGYFAGEAGYGSYVAVYAVLAAMARVVGAAAAVKLLVVGYAIAMVFAARALVRSLGGDGRLALLAAPAVYSTTLEFGFLAYLPGLPLTLVAWALVVRAMREDATPLRLAALGFAWLGVGLAHPFAAAVAGVGVAVLVFAHAGPGRGRRALGVAGVIVVGGLPAAVGLLGATGGGEARLASFEGVPLLERMTTQDFVPPWRALIDAPAHLIGFVEPRWRYVIAAALGAAACFHRATAPPLADRPPGERRAGAYLALAMVALYLITPFTFEWPRNWYGAQPRLVPLAWIALLAAIRVRPAGRMPLFFHGVALAVALGVVVVQSILPLGRQGTDLAEVIAASPERARTLALIEGPRAEAGWPPDSLRHAGAWLIAARGGYVNALPFAGDAMNQGAHIPVQLAADAPPRPAAPLPGWARTFRWDTHAAGWDQFLVADADPETPFDYFAGHASDVDLVARAGRFRLYRRRAP